MINLRSIDLNLLTVFEAAYEEKSLSRAAQRLAMTQPAVSHALARLRVAFREELFIRHSRGMTPTPTADAIYSKAAGALGLVREAVSEARGFDPKASDRRFTIAIPHPLGPLLALRLLERVKAVAPNIQLSFNTRSRPLDLQRALLSGAVDVCVDWVPAPHGSLVEERLFNDHVVAVARTGHPALRKATSAKAIVANWELVRLRPRTDWERNPLEGIRPWHQLNPRIALEVSEFLEVLVVVSQSDLLGIVPESLAETASRALGVRVVQGLPRTSTPVRMIWRDTHRKDPGHEFLRGHVRSATSALASPRRRVVTSPS